MTEPKAGPRPVQVTVAAAVAAAGSALLVLTLFDSVSSLETVGVRQEIAQVLTQSGHPWGLTVASTVHLLRELMLFAGGTAAAATVLAVYTLFRHRGARIGLTIAAALLLLTVVSGAFGLLVAAATAMLWSRPARDWFAGRPPAPAPQAAGKSAGHPVESPRHAAEGAAADGGPAGPHDEPWPLFSAADEGGQTGERPAAPESPPEEEAEPRPAPPPTYGFGTPQAHQGPPPPAQPYPGAQQGSYPGDVQHSYPGQPAYPPPGGWPPPSYGMRPTAPPGRRPATVTVAAVLTWLFSGIAMAGFLIAIGILLTDRTDVVNAISTNPRFRDANISENQIIAVFWVACAVIVFWCAVAMVLAFLAFRGHNWARITLVVSAVVSALFCLTALPVTLAHLIVAVAVIVLLFTGGANAWFAGRGRAGYPPHGGHPGPQGYGQGYPEQPHEGQKPPRNVW